MKIKGREKRSNGVRSSRRQEELRRGQGRIHVKKGRMRVGLVLKEEHLTF